MTTRGRFRSASVAVTCTLVIAIPPELAARVLQAPGMAHPVAARTSAPAQTATPASTRSGTNQVPEPDGGWPGIYQIEGGGTATLYQPQVASWTGQRQMVAWSAVSYARADLKEPALGTIKIEAETSVASEERLVNFKDFRVTESNFPSLSRDQMQALLAGLQKAVPDHDRVIALDRVLAAVDKSTIRPRDVPGIKADAPQVFQSSRPAVLVNLDGDPVWSAIQNVDLEYNPWTGAYGRGAAVYGPYGGAGAAAVYNPRTGTYARGAAAYGPYGGRAAAQAWNPRTGTYGQTRQGGNIYGNWGSSFVQRGDEWARTSHMTNYATGATTRSIHGDDGAGAVTRRGVAGRTSVARGQDGDIYAGHDGNVYRRGDDGTWQHWSDGGWNNTSRPGQSRVGQGGAGTRELPEASGLQLDRDRAARVQGGERTRDWSSYRRAPSMPRAGSFRGGGGRR